MKKPRLLITFVALVAFAGTIALTSTVVMAEPNACPGVSKKCGKAYDKKIGGKLYSCQKCTQALCKAGTNNLAGSKTTTTCTSKAASKTGFETDELPKVKQQPMMPMQVKPQADMPSRSIKMPKKAPGGALFPKEEVKPLLRPQEKDTGIPNPNVRIAPQPSPDLIVTIGSGMPPYFVVRNIGKGLAGASLLKIDCTQAGSVAPGRKCILVFRNYPSPDQIPVWKNIPALAPGALHTINLESVDTLLYPFDDEYTFRAEADAKRQVAEKNESNNKDTRVVDMR